MSKLAQAPDALIEPGTDGMQVRYGTALHRVNEVVDDQPQDQEFAEFRAGDVADVCRTLDEKSFKEIREAIAGKAPGVIVSLPVAACRQLVAAACRPTKTTSAK